MRARALRFRTTAEYAVLFPADKVYETWFAGLRRESEGRRVPGAVGGFWLYPATTLITTRGRARLSCVRVERSGGDVAAAEVTVTHIYIPACTTDVAYAWINMSRVEWLKQPKHRIVWQTSRVRSRYHPGILRGWVPRPLVNSRVIVEIPLAVETKDSAKPYTNA